MKSRGDTIVEVLFAMVVIGLSLAAAFGIANRNLQISRSSQERTEAQRIAESQIEFIKAALSSEDLPDDISDITSTNAGDFCLYKDADNNLLLGEEDSDECLNVAQLDSGVSYSVDIDVETEGSRVVEYAVTVTWERIGTSSDEEGTLTMYYRPGYVSSNCTSDDINLSTTALSVTGGDVLAAIRMTDVDVGITNNVVSNPGFILSTPLTTFGGCDYVVDYTVYCAANVNNFGAPPAPRRPGAPACPSAGAQNQERVVVRFWETYSGTERTARCTGDVVATFETVDGMRGNNDTVFNPPPTGLTINKRNTSATCMQFEHFCSVNPTVGSCNSSPRSSHSVQMHLLGWSEV